jgi:hypothetical protein
VGDSSLACRDAHDDRQQHVGAKSLGRDRRWLGRFALHDGRLSRRRRHTLVRNNIVAENGNTSPSGYGILESGMR